MAYISPVIEQSRCAVVFIHGIFPSVDTWHHFDDLMKSDSSISELKILHFEYWSPKFKLNPMRRIPNINDAADSLRSFIEIEAQKFDGVILVAHSQGGLVVQRYLSRMLMDARGEELLRIRRIVLIACPNSGSEFLIGLRKSFRFWHNPQERGLRVNDADVAETERRVIKWIVNASKVSPHQCPIAIVAYVGESDNVVPPSSAKGLFKISRVLPGDHASIIRPDSIEHRIYKSLMYDLEFAFATRALEHKPNPSLYRSNEIDDRSVGPKGSEEVVIVRVGRAEFFTTSALALTWIKELNQESPNHE